MTEGYRVLARKYRPQTFADLIGQEAMVRTLKNAFAGGRVHHAFILTGIRGTGKTSTARIIAKGLNCIGPDGTGNPTTEPCGLCEHCRAIAEGRHVDVLEMDAASRTGVADIREIIDTVAYRAASARYKVYIIDEVHMLSTSAFNALLKTLEEPPPHVKFIFATTEIRKVPVTVLSRCQRFDLRRIEPEVMIAHLQQIAAAESVEAESEALALITRAAEGSVRDALSLLDQAIAMGAGRVTAANVRAMLGLADRARVLDLFEAVLRGDIRSALAELAAQYADGAEPAAVLKDLAEVTHWISLAKVAPEALRDPSLTPEERRRGEALAERLSLRVLQRQWQMLLKALDEVASAPNAMMAAEMALIRLTHAADLPPPDELIRRLSVPMGARAVAEAAEGSPRREATGVEKASGFGAVSPSAERANSLTAAPSPPPPAAHEASRRSWAESRGQVTTPAQDRSDVASHAEDRTGREPPAPCPEASLARAEGGGESLPPPSREEFLAKSGEAFANAGAWARAPNQTPAQRARAAGEEPSQSVAATVHAGRAAFQAFPDFQSVLALVRARRDAALLTELEDDLRLVCYAPGKIVFQPADTAAPDLALRLARKLQAWTGLAWAVSAVSDGGGPTIREARRAAEAARIAAAQELSAVKAVLAAFPGAKVVAVRETQSPATPAFESEAPSAMPVEEGEDAAAPDDDTWDFLTMLNEG